MRFQGNWIPHKLRKATDDGVFFAGDSAGHCLPVTAEGIRTAFYFGARAAGASCAPSSTASARASEALARYAQFNDAHAHTYLWLKRVQNLVGTRQPHAAHAARDVRAFRSERLSRWAFDHYLAIAPPQFALAAAAPARRARWRQRR